MGGDTDGTGDFGGTAWLWDGTALHNLNTELTAQFPAVLSGLTVCACMAINSSNQILVWATNSSQYPETFVLSGTPGDANIDGRVDINDLTIVLAHYGQTGAVWSTGDFVGDGRVDINDLTIVLAHYGQTLGSSAAAIDAVPEPSAIAITAVALLGLLTYAWRQRKSKN